MNYDWQDVLRRLQASGHNFDGNSDLGGSAGQSGQAWVDPLTGLVVNRENGQLLASTNDVADKSQGDVQTWDLANPNGPGQGWYSTPRSIGRMLGDTAKDLAPLALSALAMNYLGPLMGGAEGAAGGAASAPSAELTAFLEANMGAGAPVGAGGGWAGAAGGLPEVSFGPWGATPEFGVEFINAAGDVGAAGGGGYTGTSMAGATGGLTPAALEATLGTPGYGLAGAAGGAALGIPAVLNGAGAGLPFAGATPGLFSGLGSLADIAKVAAPLLGGIAGAQGTPGGTSSNQRTLDPRIDSWMFGTDTAPGLLKDAMDFAKNNPTGMNDTMRQASSGMRSLLGDPNVMAALYQQGAAGTQMLRQPVAGNAFTRPGFNGTNWGG